MNLPVFHSRHKVTMISLLFLIVIISLSTWYFKQSSALDITQPIPTEVINPIFVDGIVRKENGTPFANGSITFGSRTVSTNTQGYYQIALLEEGTYPVSFRDSSRATYQRAYSFEQHTIIDKRRITRDFTVSLLQVETNPTPNSTSSSTPYSSAYPY